MPDILTAPAGRPSLSATSDDPVVTETVPTPDPAPPPPQDATPEPPEAEVTEPAEPKPEPPKQNSYQRRISELTSARRTAEQRADQLAANLEKALDALNKMPAPKADEPAPDPKPARDAFADPDSYDAALIEWSTRTATRLATAEMERKAAERQAAEEKQRSEQADIRVRETLAATWQQKRGELMGDPQFADFVEVAENPDLEIPVSVLAAAMHTENGPKVLYHLGKHPEEASRIAKLNPMQQAIEIGRVWERLAQPERPQTTKAPKPIEPVGVRATAAPKTRDEMTMDEYAAARTPELMAARRVSMFGQRAH